MPESSGLAPMPELAIAWMVGRTRLTTRIEDPLMAQASKLMLILARMNPAMYDALFPHYPLIRETFGATKARSARTFTGDEVMLQPQPLPPKDAFLVASAEVAQEISRAAIAAEVTGGSPASIVAEAMDGWCGTPVPWPWPWPWPWSGPWGGLGGGDPEPHPEWDFDASRLVGSLTLASVAARMQDGEARTALDQGAEQLLAAALESRAIAPGY
jgi:hypothetical protein